MPWASERRLWLPAKHVGVFHDERRGGLIAGVGLPLLLPHGNRPASGLGVDGLVVPVGALHKTDPHGRAAVLRPGGERREVAGRLVQVALHDDAAVGPAAKLVLHGDPLEDREREVLGRMALHVDVDLRARVTSKPPERPQSREDAVRRTHGIDGVEPAVEGGEFQ